jgi:hypothetical protein
MKARLESCPSPLYWGYNSFIFRSIDIPRAKETGGQRLSYNPINPTPPISFLFDIEIFLLFY